MIYFTIVLLRLYLARQEAWNIKYTGYSSTPVLHPTYINAGLLKSTEVRMLPGSDQYNFQATILVPNRLSRTEWIHKWVLPLY